MQERSYAKRSWALLTQQKGWIKPVLVLAAAQFVPIVGGLGASGYALEWARLTAWGVDAAPKQKNVKVGPLIASGWRAFVVGLGWMLCFGLASGILNGIAELIPGAIGDLLVAFLTVVLGGVQLLFATVISIARLRAAIYERIGAGYRIDRVFDMIKRDTTGFFHLVVIELVSGFVAAIVVVILIAIGTIAVLPAIVAASNASSEYAMAMMLAQSLGGVLIIGLVLGYGLSIVANGYYLVFANAVALWMRQFDVPAWGKSEDPLPEPDARQASVAMPVAPVQPQSPAPQPQPQPQPQPAPQPVVVREPEPVVAPEPLPEPQPEPEPPAEPDVTTQRAPQVDDADVAGLYDQLYDVMHRDDNPEDK